MDKKIKPSVDLEMSGILGITNPVERGPVCPYCGSVNDASDSDGILWDESTDEYTCDVCDRDFAVMVFVTHSWSTSPIKQK